MRHTLVLAPFLGAAALAYAEEPAPAPVPAPAPETEAAPASDPAASAADLAALTAKVEELQAQVEAQHVEITRQRGELEKVPDFKFEVQGTYRMRGYVFGGLFEDIDRPAKVMDHRLRITPIMRYKSLAKLELTIDGLDNVVWGDNESLASTALFAGNPSTTADTGFRMPSMQLERVWMEATVPFGVLRVGRMGSDWGMGLLANDGNGFDDDFGENRGGSTVDRVLFATRPVAIGQFFAGKDDTKVPFYAAIGVDRLVEEPLIAYYGYECTPGIAEADPDYDSRCDRDHDGVTDLEHGNTDDTRTEDTRDGDWWADSDDDVLQVVGVLIYRGENIRYFGAPGVLTGGVYLVARHQKQTDSKVLVLDGYLKAQTHGVYLEGEVLHIGGETRAIALPGSVNPDSDDALFKKADIWGYVVRAGWGNDIVRGVVETGYASGDHNVADESFTGRPLHPDYNVGLILYEEVLARATATTWSPAAEGLWSNGGVYNSKYVMPTVHLFPFAGWAAGETEIIASWLMAWPDQPDGSIIRCREGDNVECSLYQATAAPIGWEADLAIKHVWHKHLAASLEGGYAKVTDRIPLEAIGLDPDGQIWTFQVRAGWQF